MQKSAIRKVISFFKGPLNTLIQADPALVLELKFTPSYELALDTATKQALVNGDVLVLIPQIQVLFDMITTFGLTDDAPSPQHVFTRQAELSLSNVVASPGALIPTKPAEVEGQTCKLIELASRIASLIIYTNRLHLGAVPPKQSLWLTHFNILFLSMTARRPLKQHLGIRPHILPSMAQNALGPLDAILCATLCPITGRLAPTILRNASTDPFRAGNRIIPCIGVDPRKLPGTLWRARVGRAKVV